MIKHVLKDYLVYGLSILISRGMGIILVPLYTRVLSPQDFGAFDLFLTFGAIINLVIALEISQGQARFWNESDDKTQLASTVLWFTVLMYLFFILVSLRYSNEISNILLGNVEYIEEFKIGVVFIAANGIYQTILSQLRWELKSKTYAAISILQGIILLIGVLICYYYAFGLEEVLLVQALSFLVAATIASIVVRRHLCFKVNLTELRNLLAFSLPLVPAAVGTLIYTHIGKVFLTNTYGLQEVGMLGLATRISGVAVILFVGIKLALTPIIYKDRYDPEMPYHLAQLFNVFFAGTLLLCLTMSLFSDELISLLATDEYSVSSGVIGLLTLSIILFQLYIFFPGIALEKRTKIQLYITAITAVVCLISNSLMTPMLGIIGVAISSLLSSLTFFVLWINASQQFYYVPISPHRISLVIGLLIVVVALRQFFGELYNFGTILKAVIITGFILILFYFKFLSLGKGISALNLLKK